MKPSKKAGIELTNDEKLMFNLQKAKSPVNANEPFSATVLNNKNCRKALNRFAGNTT